VAHFHVDEEDGNEYCEDEHGDKEGSDNVVVAFGVIFHWQGCFWVEDLCYFFFKLFCVGYIPIEAPAAACFFCHAELRELLIADAGYVPGFAGYLLLHKEQVWRTEDGNCMDN